jgi:hypothetical protein
MSTEKMRNKRRHRRRLRAAMELRIKSSLPVLRTRRMSPDLSPREAEEWKTLYGPARPWQRGLHRYPEQAMLLRGVLAHREALEGLDPWLPFPGYACCFSFGKRGAPLPLGALLLLWDSWKTSTGTCRFCRGPVRAYSFGGLLAIGGLGGCCAECGLGYGRSLGGYVTVAHLLNLYLAGTPFKITGGVMWGTVPGPRRPLAEALRALGWTEMPTEEWLDDTWKPVAGLYFRKDPAQRISLVLGTGAPIGQMPTEMDDAGREHGR